MKHYFTHDAKGRLVGVHTYHHEGTKLGGWPDHIRPEHDEPEHEVAQNLRDSHLGKENGAVGFVAYDCPCPPTKTRCNCAGVKLGHSRLVDGKLVNKKTGGFIVDGAPVTHGTKIKRPPGTPIQVYIACVGIADGEKAIVYQGGRVQLIDADKPIELTFKDGRTENLDVVAPAQGFLGAIRVQADDMVGLELAVLGWGA